MSWSIWAFIIALVISFLSMGLVGAIVYIFVSPVLRIKYPPMNQWSGDWVWPTNIIVSIVWCLGFLLAGAVNLLLKHHNIIESTNVYVYLGVLWFWGLLVWWVVLAFSYKDE